ncbi:hypothetical protein FACS189452_10860 [Bacteroidia bacterium]|nr:hypothetical protein FACS189452_10860 [Bacteroidia bacterium]
MKKVYVKAVFVGAMVVTMCTSTVEVAFSQSKKRAKVLQKADGKSSQGGKTDGAVYSPDGIEMVYVEGTGSGILAIQGFYIGKYEVTQSQYQAIVGTNPSEFKGANNPVEMVSWDDAQEFITKLNARTGRNYRLPTEAEWKYAAREGKKESRYNYSGSDDIGAVAWYSENIRRGTRPVGQKLPNALGLYDMTGNVWEWCQDWCTEGSSRVARGGGWGSLKQDCGVIYRGCYTPGNRYNTMGIRLVLP